MQYQIIKIKHASDEIQMEKNLDVQILITNLYYSLTRLNCLVLDVEPHKKILFLIYKEEHIT